MEAFIVQKASAPTRRGTAVAYRNKYGGDVYGCAEAKCLQPQQEARAPRHTGN